MRNLIPLFVIGILVATPLPAQLQAPAGISAHRASEVQARGVPAAEVTLAAMPDAATTRSRWKWIAVGAVIGGAACGLLASRQVARRDDAFFGGPTVELGVAVEVVGGGLIGALAHAMLHPAPSALAQNLH